MSMIRFRTREETTISLSMMKDMATGTTVEKFGKSQTLRKMAVKGKSANLM